MKIERERERERGGSGLLKHFLRRLESVEPPSNSKKGGRNTPKIQSGWLDYLERPLEVAKSPATDHLMTF
jgi:hypothetical protein